MGEKELTMPVEHHEDPWTRIMSRRGMPADELISAFQKGIRRGDVELVARVADECYRTSAELEAKLWTRILVSAVEDVGLAQPLAPVVVGALHRAHTEFAHPEHDRFLLLLHAARYLAESPKDRSTDDLANWVKLTADDDGVLPVIPDHAIDMHTRRGQELGRDHAHFLAEASRVEPDATTDRTWGEALRRRVSGD
jgi:replication-associated recombination protein RarA